MANKKKQSNPIYTLSGYAKLYVKNGEAYGLMLSGSYEDEDGERHYVNLWKKIQNGNVKITTAKNGNPALHLGMLEVTTVYKDGDSDGEDDKPQKKAAEEPKRPKLEKVDDLPF